jgi:hypothetical protein
METTTENSSMFTLEMLTKQAREVAAEPQKEAPASAHHVFSPVLAAPVVEEKTTRVSGWVFVAAFVAFIAPIIAVTAYTTTHAPTPKPVPSAQPGTIKVTGPETVASVTPSASATIAEAPKQEPNCMCMPKAKPIPPAPRATATVKHEAPKCCAGESEMQCAMRRSVGATC